MELAFAAEEFLTPAQLLVLVLAHFLPALFEDARHTVCSPTSAYSKGFGGKLQVNDGSDPAVDARGSRLRACLPASLDRPLRDFYTAVMNVYVMMPKWWICAGMAFVIAGAIGCSSKTIQYPEDHERYLKIDKAVESLRRAYVKKDGSAMTALMVPIESLERLQHEAESDFDLYQAIALEFRVERIIIENDDIDVYVHWQGVWKKTPDDPGLRQRGHARLQWVGTKAVLLRDVQGDVPFGMKGRQSGSGQSPSPKK